MSCVRLYHHYGAKHEVSFVLSSPKELSLKPIFILGEFSEDNPTHLATNDAIKHSADFLTIKPDFQWVHTDLLNLEALDRAGGIIVAPGSPYANMNTVLEAIKIARLNGIPCLGTCGGFQHIIIETARNVLGYQDADHAESNPYASTLFISRLACSLVGRTMELKFAEGSKVANIYGTESAEESFYCNFGVNPEYVPLLKKSSLVISGSDSEGEVRVVEIPSHPFFIGTLYVPQARSTPERPHPMINSFLQSLL